MQKHEGKGVYYHFDFINQLSRFLQLLTYIFITLRGWFTKVVTQLGFISRDRNWKAVIPKWDSDTRGGGSC